ncbi:MAG TPA: hypothetical protein PKC18_03670 [Lacipirellulaceae bacterium]|nr:hypothetical protein [Lacipirellulaceae bacterium]
MQRMSHGWPLMLAAILWLILADRTRAVEWTSALADEIERRFPPSAPASSDEPSSSVPLGFTRSLIGGAPPRALDHDAPNPPPSFVEQCIAAGYPRGVRRYCIEGVALRFRDESQFTFGGLTFTR